MGGLFRIDGPVMETLNKLADLLILSILWLVCCLPIVTIGASTTALYYASIKSILGEGTVVKNFVKSFRENWKQAILVELILAIVAYIFYIDFQVVFAMEGSLAGILRIFFLALLFLFFSTVSYLFPLLSRFVYSTGALFKNALLMSFMNLPKTILIVFVNLLPALILLLLPSWFLRLLPLFLFFGSGLQAYINSLLFLGIFRKYMPKEDSLSPEQDETE